VPPLKLLLPVSVSVPLPFLVSLPAPAMSLRQLSAAAKLPRAASMVTTTSPLKG
jgi:hypothetical protein